MHIIRLPLFVLGIGSLVACTPLDSLPSSSHGKHGEVMMHGEGREMVIDDQSTETAVQFSVREGDSVFMDYGVSHTKEMHLLVVRRDLRHFYHLHPNRDDAGNWGIPFAPAAGGEYWLFADFVDIDGASHTLRFERRYKGAKGIEGITKDFTREKVFGAYHVALIIAPLSHGLSFTYRVTDAAGHPVVLEEYLGALGHSVLISPNGDFVHTHPSHDEQGGAVVFEIPIPTDAFYRVFTQFQIGGEVVTLDFDWTRD